jgi:opacity protein-like surface antigen
MRKILLIIFIAGMSISSFAGDQTRKGTSGADQLLIPVGAKSIATGGAFLSRIKGVESIYYNPAGLDLMNGTEVMFDYLNYIADIGQAYFAIGTQLGDFGSIAFSYKTLSFGDIPVTTFENPDGTGQTYSPNFFVAGVTYSKSLTDRVSAGVNFKLINESIMNANASGIAIDFGVQYNFNVNFSLAAAVKNIGTNMTYSGDDLKIRTEIPGSGYGSSTGLYQAEAESFGMPSYFELSVAYSYFMNDENNLAIGGAFRNNNNLEDQMMFGLEYGFMNTFFIRGGYDLLLQNNDQSIYDFTAGAGINYETSSGITIGFDYAYRNIKEFSTANHVFTAKIGIQ